MVDALRPCSNQSASQKRSINSLESLLMREQPAFNRERRTGAPAHETTDLVLRDDTVTGHDYSDRIGAARRADGSGRATNFLRDIAVGSHFTRANARQQAPHTLLVCRALNRDR